MPLVPLVPAAASAGGRFGVAAEARRLAAVRALGLLDSGADERFDRIVRVAALLFDVEAILRAHRAALVVADRPGLHFQTQAMTADWTFVRFHHGHRGRRGNYSRSELGEWAQRLRAWAREREAFAFFNNDWEAFAPRNAALLTRLLAAD